MFNEKFITFEKVLDIVPYSRVHIYRMMKEDKFPKSVKLGPNRIAFVKTEVDAWVAAHIEQRDTRSS